MKLLDETELRYELDKIFPSPATGTRGQGGLPRPHDIQAYSMYYTSDGKEDIYQKLLQLFKEQKQAWKESDVVIGLFSETLENLFKNMVKHKNDSLTDFMKYHVPAKYYDERRKVEEQ